MGCATLTTYGTGHRIRRSLILTPYDGPVIDESFDSACRVVSVATLFGDEPDRVTFRGNCLGAYFVLVQGVFGFTRIGEEERRDGEAIALHKTHIWANSLKQVCFLCFLLFWCLCYLSLKRAPSKYTQKW